MNWYRRLILVAAVSSVAHSHTVAADLPVVLRELDATVLTNEEREFYDDMISRDIERRRLLAIQRENRAWSQVETRDDWEQFRDQRINALRNSLGRFPPAPKQLNVETTGRIEGDGYRIENIVFESRPGLFVTANLYLPSKPEKSMPAILLSHSHHAPKTQGELQDMGMIWARQGCAVLVMDHLGHGERRQNPFVSGSDYEKPFRVSRQDYYFRYNTGLQLQLVGESLIGWMAWDLMRGVDLLCARDDVDRDRIILIGAVAGGGDPAGVTAALDSRISAVAPFNFGGPQPDYQIPEDAKNQFYYFGVAYWETTRCLRLGGRDGFAHWTIVGSVAPRRLIYSFEFDWDRQRDPVWPRLEKVFGFYEARDHLDVATGRGDLKGQPPESSHCTNVGAYHRSKFYPHLKRWFDLEPPPEEFQQRRETSELLCLTPDVKAKLNPKSLYELAGELGTERVSAARGHRRTLGSAEKLMTLRQGWSQLLGDIEPTTVPKVLRTTTETTNDLAVERVLLEIEDGIVVPIVMIRSASTERRVAPTVICLSRAGKQELLVNRSEEISKLIAGGAVVCLPDLRGTGETRPGSEVGRGSTGTTLSCRDQVLGQTLLGSRLRDLRSILRYVRKHGTSAIALWGESLSNPNPEDRSEIVPHDVENPNVQSEPTAGFLALLGALYEDDVKAVCAQGTFASFGSLLDSPFLYVPHDAVVSGAMTVSDVSDIAAVLAPRPLMIANPIDGLNRSVSDEDLRVAFAVTTDAFRDADAADRLSLVVEPPTDVADWLLSHLKQ
ncbi:MAG TPA: acetylxylan esterase [Planctomycetaceae bacterium]|nr:acetylxylan esterase [Planctomycetaceae bacterium]